MRDETTLPIVTDAGRGLDRRAARRYSRRRNLAANQKSARTRRAYRLDVQHFMKTLGITTAAELRQADHKAVIAWEGQPSTNCGASSSAPSSPTSPAPSGSFGCSHWCSAIVG